MQVDDVKPKMAVVEEEAAEISGKQVTDKVTADLKVNNVRLYLKDFPEDSNITKSCEIMTHFSNYSYALTAYACQHRVTFTIIFLFIRITFAKKLLLIFVISFETFCGCIFIFKERYAAEGKQMLNVHIFVLDITQSYCGWNVCICLSLKFDMNWVVSTSVIKLIITISV